MQETGTMLYLNEKHLKELISNVEPYSEECCGFLFGSETGNKRNVTSVMPAKNIATGDKRCVFEIAPKDYLNAEEFALANALQLLGIYHSHPNHPAVPSEYDTIAAHPYFSYVILSVMNKKFADIRSWTLNNNLTFVEEQIIQLS